MWNWQTRSMKSPHARNLILRICYVVRVDCLLRFEDSIHTLCRNDRLIEVTKDERRILTIKNDDIDLFAECTFAIHDVSGFTPVTTWKVRLQKISPNVLASSALCTRMSEGFSCSGQPILNIFV